MEANQQDARQAQPRGDARPGIGARLRNYFLAGVAIAAPIYLTIYLLIWLTGVLDDWFLVFIPEQYRPEQYMPFTLPGVGILLVVILLTLLGAFTANLVGRAIVAQGQRLLLQLPVVRTIYGALRPIFEVVTQHEGAFHRVALFEYPRRGVWALAFVTGDAGEEISRIGGEEMVMLFRAATPNVTSGYLFFVPRKDVHYLDMSVEAAARLLISGGLVGPPEETAELATEVTPEAAASKSSPSQAAQ